ncbi:hypothetical protein VSR34_06205 [Paraburkholderia sp. JHI2823]|uniref:hypothetical protein n=1 Tax=Paraburkholderia TaxID=1822464 RepID=UPI000419475A|nr:hypothetical protein [Paraburkholderia mimosarum]
MTLTGRASWRAFANASDANPVNAYHINAAAESQRIPERIDERTKEKWRRRHSACGAIA